MDRDTEQLNLLAIFHYVVAGLAALFSFFPLIYTAVGVIFIFAARHGTAKPGEELPPEFLGWIFAVLGSVLFVIGIAMAICILIAGRSLALRKRYSFALVIACIECLFVPFGTILGVFTIVALSRESVRALFSKATVQSAGLKLASDLNDRRWTPSESAEAYVTVQNRDSATYRRTRFGQFPPPGCPC